MQRKFQNRDKSRTPPPLPVEPSSNLISIQKTIKQRILGLSQEPGTEDHTFISWQVAQGAQSFLSFSWVDAVGAENGGTFGLTCNLALKWLLRTCSRHWVWKASCWGDSQPRRRIVLSRNMDRQHPPSTELQGLARALQRLPALAQCCQGLGFSTGKNREGQ